MKLIGSKRAIRSAEFHKKKEKQRKMRLTVSLLLFAVLLISPFYILGNNKLQISGVEVEGNGVTSKSEVEALVFGELEGKVLGFLPKTSALLYPEKEIEESLLSSIPRLASVNVSLMGTKTIKVTMTEREPSALYCEDVSIYRESRGCYFMDNTGLIYSEAPDFAGGVYTVYTSEPLLEDPMRIKFFEVEELYSLQSFITGVKNLGLDPKFIVKRGDEYTLILPSGTDVRWKAEQNLDNLLVDFGSFMKDSELNQSDIEKFEYLDLRFENKIYWVPRE